MSNRLADNISPALMAELDQTAAEMLAMVFIRRDGEVEMHARADISRPGIAAALRRLAEDAANTGVPKAKRLRPKDRAIKAKLVHCYVTVAVRYMIEGQQ